MNVFNINYKSVTMTTELAKLNTWNVLHCPNCHNQHGYQTDFAVIVGGTYIQQTKIRLLCVKCGKIKVFHSKSTEHLVFFLTQDKIESLINGSKQVKDLLSTRV